MKNANVRGASIETTNADVIWNYIGTIVSMASNFVLLPLLMRFLSPEELGLWYVYVAISNLAMLFDFGFNPTFARNIVYVVSGARRLTSEGCDASSIEAGIDWHLLNVVITTTRLVFAAIAIVVTFFLSTIGSVYIETVSSTMSGSGKWISWAIFCISVFLNLFFLYSTTLLRGYGDIAGENRTKTLAKLSQLVISAVLLASGFGLVGASLGYLANGLLLRVFASIQLRHHTDIASGRASDTEKPNRKDICDVLATVGHLAWKDGLVQIASYASTQAMSIVSSLTLGLAETGTYSVLLQLGNAVYNFASAYPKSFFPAFQSASASNDRERQVRIVARGVTAYWALFLFGMVGVSVVILPILALIRPGFDPNVSLFLGVCLYLGFWNHHCIFCNYIIGMNEVPYMGGYVGAAVIGTVLAFILSGPYGMGAWGLVLGQGFSQACYNNWKWPMYLCRKIGTTYHALLRRGIRMWRETLLFRL